MSDELERRVRELEQEMAALRGWHEAVSMRDDKVATWWPVVIAIVAILMSSLLPFLVGR